MAAQGGPGVAAVAEIGGFYQQISQMHHELLMRWFSEAATLW